MNDKELEILAELENIDLAKDTIRGATIDIEKSYAKIVDIIHGGSKEELFALDRDADAKELLVNIRN